MIGALVALLSLDVTRKLVAAGMVATTLTIVGASNTTPIVVQTASAHGFTRPAHAVVSGVGGNDTANGFWILSPVDGTHLALSTYTPQGIPLPSVGSGVYTSGGIAEVAFPDGSILLGRRNVAMLTAVATPRIVFVPIGSPVWDLAPYGGAIPPATVPRARANETDEQLTMKLQRQLATERQRFEVHVTGCASPPDPDFGDFDVTQAIYQSLYASMFNLISDASVLSGKWTSQDVAGATVTDRGQKWVGIVEIAQPVLDDTLAFLPSSTHATIIVNLVGGSTADQVVIVTPDL